MSKQVKVGEKIYTVPDDATPEAIGEYISSQNENIAPIPEPMDVGDRIGVLAQGFRNKLPDIGGIANFALESFKENPLFPLKPAAEKFVLSQADQYNQFMDAMGANSDAGFSTKAAGALATLPVLGSMMVSGAKATDPRNERAKLEGSGELAADTLFAGLPMAPRAISETARFGSKVLQSPITQGAAKAGVGAAHFGMGGTLAGLLRKRLISNLIGFDPIAGPMDWTGRQLSRVNLQWPNLSGRIAPKMGPAPVLEQMDELSIPPVSPRTAPPNLEDIPEFPVSYRVKSMKSGQPIQIDDMYPEGFSRATGTSKRDLGLNPRAIDKLPDNVRKALDEKGSIEIVKKGDEVAIYDADGNDITKAIGAGAKSDTPVVIPGMSLRERGINPRRIKALPDAVRKFVEKNREDLMAIKEDGDDFIIHMRKDGKDFTKRMNAVGKEPKAVSVAEKPPTEQVSDTGGVSPEELSRPGVFYKMGKSGEPTYLGKKVDAGNLKEGEAIIQVDKGEARLYQGSGNASVLEKFKNSEAFKSIKSSASASKSPNTPSFSEMKDIIGKEGTIREGGLQIPVKITDVKNSYGDTRYHVVPLTGGAGKWVSSYRFGVKE